MPVRPRVAVAATAAVGPLLTLFLPASIAWSPAGGVVFLLLVLAGLAIALAEPASAWRALRARPGLLAVVILVVGANVASVLLNGLAARDLALAPILLVVPIVLACERTNEAPAWLSLGGAAGGTVALAIALAEWSRSESDPIIGTLNAIVFAQLAVVGAACSLAGATRARQSRSAIASLAGTAFGALAVLASGTRGAILALPVIAGALAPHRRRWRQTAATARRAIVIGLLATAMAGAALAWRSNLPARFERIVAEVAAFRAGDTGQHSVGMRLALWRASIEIASEHPWFGVGANRFKPALQRLQQDGRYPADSTPYSHPHNTPLSILVQYGAAGLAVFVAALALGWRALGRAPPEIRALGRTLICLWFVVSLTNDVLAHNNTLRALCVCWAVLASVRWEDDPRPTQGPLRRWPR